MTGISDQPLIRVQGDYWPFPFRYTDSAGDPISLVGKTMSAAIKWDDGSIDLTVSGLSLADGLATFSASTAQSATVPAGHDAKLYIRAADGSGPQTLAIVPLVVIEAP